MKKIDQKLLTQISDFQIDIGLSDKEKKYLKKRIIKNLSEYLIEFIPVTSYENIESKNSEEIRNDIIGKYPEAKLIQSRLIEMVLENMDEVRTVGENSSNFYYIPKKRDYSKIILARNNELNLRSY